MLLLGAPEEEAIPGLPLPLALDSVYEEYGYRSLIPPPAYNLSYGPGPLPLEGRDLSTPPQCSGPLPLPPHDGRRRGGNQVSTPDEVKSRKVLPAEEARCLKVFTDIDV